MSSIAAQTTARSNGDGEESRVQASWWNDFRTLLINLFGNGTVNETQFTIADNQAAYVDITGLLLDQTVTRAVRIDYTIYRTDGAGTSRREMGSLFCAYKPIAATWALSRSQVLDDALNVASSLQITNAGQIQYKSDSVGGTYSGKMRYKVTMAFNTET